MSCKGSCSESENKDLKSNNNISIKSHCCDSCTQEEKKEDKCDGGCSCHSEAHEQTSGCSCGSCSCSSDHDKEEYKIPLWISLLISALIIIPCFIFNPPAIVTGILFGIVTLFWGYDLLWDGLKSITSLKLNESALMTIAIVAAFALGEYFEALMVTMFFAIGEAIENKVIVKSRKSIKDVINIRPENANLIDQNGNVKLISSSSIKVDDILLIKVGERIPVDCVITTGTSSLDQSALTGESVAVGVQEGDAVLSGGVNLSSVITCKATSTFENSTASRIINLVEKSSSQKGKTEKLITKFARIYTPIVVLGALIVATIPPLLLGGEWSDWISRSLTFLVASCPCSLIISIPLAFYSGVGACSRQGLLIKGTKFIEPLSKTNAIVFDKTGTVTSGKLSVSKATAVNLSEQDFKFYTSIAESYSNHPIAKAVVAHLGDISSHVANGTDLTPSIQNVKEIPGKGISMFVQGKHVICGSRRMMIENGIEISDVYKANIFTSVDGILAGYIVLSDTPRPEAKDAINTLKKSGIKKTVMLTGDNITSAEAVKLQCNIDELHAELLPENKATILSDVKKKYTALFIGDGINDAPAIASADVGIAMGMGTDAAIESADAVLMSENLRSIVSAINIAKRTMKVVKFNIAFILAIKLVVLVLATLNLAPMWLAVVADVGLAIIAVLNAATILKVKS